MAERKRAIQLKFYVTEQERILIEEKMKLLQTDNLGAYLRKMAIDGYIIQLEKASRSWAMIHTGNINSKMQEAKDTLFMAEKYMDSLGKEFERLRKQKITESQLKEYVGQLLPLDKGATAVQEKNIMKLREDMFRRYYDAPDLRGVENNAYRFINAVSDFATHAAPLRRTANSYKQFEQLMEQMDFSDREKQLF